MYNNGDTFRNTVVTITENPNVTQPVVQFDSEQPYLQYNINVVVKSLNMNHGCMPRPVVIN
jgi:hypothetical protein